MKKYFYLVIPIIKTDTGYKIKYAHLVKMILFYFTLIKYCSLQ